jgi:thioredoxin 2
MGSLADMAPTTVTIRCGFCGRRNRVDMTRATARPRCADCGRPILLDRPRAVTAEEFHETVAEAGVPVLVDFHADWCGPCKVTAPMLDELAHRHQGRVLVLKVDTDRYPELAQQHGIRGIPTLLLFDEGREVRRHVGAANLAQLEQLAGV